MHQLAPESAAYSVALGLRLPASTDLLALRCALQTIVDRHDVLRSTYALDGAVPVRRIHASCAVPFDEVDARGWSAECLDEVIARRRAEPFDLAAGPLLRFALFRRETECVLLVVGHHIAMDGWSNFAVMVPEARAAYAAIVDGDSAAVAPRPSATYADYAQWESTLVESPVGDEHRAYWHTRLKGHLPVLRLRSDRPRPARKRYVGATHHFSVPRDLVHDLKQLARRQRTTLSTVLLSAFAVLLERYSGQTDLIIGLALSGRTDRRFKRTVGYFVSPVALRLGVEADAGVGELVRATHAALRGALAHQDYPLARLVEEVQPIRDPARSPLFDVMFNFIGAQPLTPLDGPDRAAELLPISVYPVPQQEGQFDLALEFVDSEQSLEAELRYSTDLFEPTTVEGMAALYVELLTAMAVRADSTVAELPQLDLAEWNRLAQSDEQTAEGVVQPGGGVPSTPVEEIVCAIFAEVLGTDRVAVDADFFALGGSSLQATQVVARIADTFGSDLPVRTLFEAPTVRALACHIDTNAEPISVPRVARGGPLALSFTQERMWFVHAISPESSAYNVVSGIRLRGVLDVELLERAANILVQRHEMLRTSIHIETTGPVQVISSDVTIRMPVIDLTDDPDELPERASALAAMPFDLSEPPLMRLGLLRVATEVHVLVLALHHVVADAWSLAVLAKELADVYQSLQERDEPHLPELPFQYADFARWQRDWFQGEVLQQQVAYWQRELAGVQPLQLPTDRPRPPVQTYRGTHRAFEFPRPLLEQLRTWSQSENATPFMAFLTGFASVLHRYTSQTDFAIGVPIANRRWLHTEGLVGPLVNTLALRTEVSANSSGSELLRQIRTRALNAYTHQDVPFDVLVAQLQPDRAANGSPLFQVMFDYINTPLGELHLPGLDWSPEHVDRRGSQFDLTMIVVDTTQVQQLSVEFNTELFEPATIERLVGHLETLLSAMVADPDLPVALLPLLPAEERRRVLEDGTGPSRAYPSEARVEDLMRAQAARTPEATAVIAEDGVLTYAQLELRSNQLAHLLHERGIGPGHIVAVDLERTSRLPIALLGILKSGAAYLPMDPAYPAERRRFVLEDSGAIDVVTLAWLDESKTFSCDPLSHQGTPDDIAYVIYTSGSTGRPKGVRVGHRGVVNFLHSMRHEPGLESSDTLVAVTTLSFDIAVLELFLPLAVGARVVIAGRETAIDGHRLARLLESSRATVMQATPVTWRALLDADWSPPQRFRAICGGEPLPPDLARDLVARDVDLWNAYGPTETTVWSTLQHVTSVSERIPIGRPIANTRVYVLDGRQQPLPVGVWGELYIGGDGVAHGYLNRPELTAERFVADPTGGRMYRTGDVARFLPDGTLDVVGRLDHQLKLRGHRIEPGEIEALLRRHPAVADTCVALRASASGESHLVAYVVANAEPAPESSSLRQLLREHLPEVMVPSAFVWLEALPRTPNGKLDRAALPPPSDDTPLRSYAEARNDVERMLVAEWEHLLGRTPIGIHDNFFDLGGHSLLAMRLVYRLRDKFGWHVPLVAFLRSASIAELGELIGRAEQGCRWRSLVEIQSEPGSVPLFVVHGLFGDLLDFAEVVDALGPRQTIFGLRAHGLDGLESPLRTVEDMAGAYIAEMRSVQPHGPYRLLGWSAGGSIVYEIACQLQAAGESVALLAILDHPPAGGAAVLPAPLPIRVGRFTAHLLDNMPYWFNVLRTANLAEKRHLVADHVGTALRALRRLAGEPLTSEAIVHDIEATHGLEYVQEWPDFRRRVLQAQLEGMTGYRPGAYEGRLLLFRCRRQPLLSSHDPLLGWGAYARGGVEVVHVPGTHRGLLTGMPARFIGAALSLRLEQAAFPGGTKQPGPGSWPVLRPTLH